MTTEQGVLWLGTGYFSKLTFPCFSTISPKGSSQSTLVSFHDKLTSPQLNQLKLLSPDVFLFTFQTQTNVPSPRPTLSFRGNRGSQGGLPQLHGSFVDPSSTCKRVCFLPYFPCSSRKGLKRHNSSWIKPVLQHVYCILLIPLLLHKDLLPPGLLSSTSLH